MMSLTNEGEMMAGSTDRTGKDVSTDVDTFHSAARADQAGVSLSSEVDSGVVEALNKQVPALLDNFKKDRNSIDEFGSGESKKLSDQVNAALERYGDGGVSDTKEIKDLLRNMNDISGEFENTSKNYGEFAIDKKTNAMIRWVKSKIHSAKKWEYDRKDVLEKFKIAETRITEQDARLKDNIDRSQHAIELNREAQQNLVKVVVANELVADAATKEYERISAKQHEYRQTDLEWNNLQRDRVAMASIIHDLGIKHTEYVSSIFSAYETEQQLTQIVNTTIGVKNKLWHILNTSIPDMKLLLMQIDSMLKARNAAEIGEKLTETEKRLSEVSATVIPEGNKYASTIAETPTMTAEEVRQRVDSVIRQYNDSLQAVKDGNTKRAELENAAVKGINDINDAAVKHDNEMIDAMLRDIDMRKHASAEISDAGNDDGSDLKVESVKTAGDDSMADIEEAVRAA